MKTYSPLSPLKTSFFGLFVCSKYHFIFSFLLIFGVSFFGHSQEGKNKDIIPVVYCVKDLNNGLYQASFGYENPTNKEVVIDENGSVVKSNNGKRVAKGLNKFKSGSVNKVFTKEFGPGDYVEWTIISNGNTHTVIANANSSKCEVDYGFIFPVYGQGDGKSEEIIGQELTALEAATAGDTPDPLIYQIINDKVLIEIVPKEGEMGSVILLLQNFFGLSYDPDPLLSDFILNPANLTSLAAIDVYFPINRLLELNAETINFAPNGINFARVLYPPIKNSVGDGFTGNAVSQGDTTQKSAIVRESFRLIKEVNGVTTVTPVDGTGITIGVMSNSFDTQPFSSNNLSQATIDVLAGDLPGAANTHGYTSDVNVIKEYPYGTASDEGRAMLHIIHDVAPGADLAFHTGSLSPRNFEVGFKALAGLNELNEVIDPNLGLKSNVIVDDITFITEPFFGEGRISESIKAFSTAGGLHFTSAGNFADTGYQGKFNTTLTQPINNDFLEETATAHIFDASTGDYLQEIAVKSGETYMIVLQWDDSSASQDNASGANVDLDFYIVDDTGRLLVGNNRSNENGDAAEIMVFTATADGTANLMITSANGATTVPFRYIAFQSSGLTLNEFNGGSPTISGHAMTEESVTVGAIRFNRDVPEAFSSYGGNLTNGSSVGVDFAAPDGVNTNVGSIGTDTYGDGTLVDGDIFKNFFGTSAAAPSAAAAVTLLQSALPTWYPQGYNGDVIQLFMDKAKGTTNPLQAGAGMIDVNNVFNSLAAQTGRITSFEFVPVTDAENASINTVTIKIIGEFLPVPADGETYETNPLVYLDGEPVPYTFVDGVIYAEIPPFSGNPVLQIYTEPKEGSEGNGGFSDPYQFFQDGKFAITVTANPPATINEDESITQNPVTIKFGEEYKSKLMYTLQGVPEGGFQDENGVPMTFEDVFPTVVFETPVDNLAYPDVNNYPVIPSFNGELYDTEKYIVNFKNGDLVIEKNYLTIKPADNTVGYGEIIQNTLVYQLTDADGTTITATDEAEYDEISNFYEAIENAHKTDFYYDTFNEGNTEPVMLLINDFNQNSESYSDITALLENGGWISSENSILNGLIRQGAVINDFRQRAVINGLRQGGVINDFRVSGIMNTLRIDKSYFTNYIASINNTRQVAVMNDAWISDTEEILNGLRQGAVINDYRVSGIMNGMRVGAIMNALDVMDLNVDVDVTATGIENGLRQLGVINTLRQSAVINGLRQSAVINETNSGAIAKDKVFSLIDYTDAPTSDTDETTKIQKLYSLNLITGVEVTNGQPHLVFPGAFLNSMAANFFITYDKGNLTIERGILTVETSSEPEVFSSNYGTPLTDKDIPTTFTTVDTNFELIEAIFANEDGTDGGIPYYFMKEGDPIEYTLNGDDKMNVGLYNIFIRDEAKNYDIEYGVNHGQLAIVEAPLTVTSTTAQNIEYGGLPDITTVFNSTDFASGENQSTAFPAGIPYFFMKEGETPDNCVDCTQYTIGGDTKMDVGVYDIFITDDANDNYKIELALDRGTLTVEPAQLTVKTTAFSVEYGDAVSEAINTVITFPLEDEGISTVFPDGIPYLFVKGADDGLNIDTVRERGTYAIEVEAPASGNYSITYDAGHGDLTITEATLTFTTIDLIIDYGVIPIIEPNFDGFAQDQDPIEDDTVLEDAEGNIPYYFMKDGEIFTMVNPTNLNVGLYDIFITDDVTDNYKFSDTYLGTLEIGKADLYVTISPNQLIIEQGDIPQLTADIDEAEFVYDDTENTVFPDGVSYYFEDEDGDEQTTADTGVLTVKIEDPINYEIVSNDAKLYINPGDVDKIRTYADCVAYDQSATDGLNYTVVYRYENDNVNPVYISEGADNNLSGPASYEGQIPVTFLPGNGTFEIRFDGKKLVWSLTTGGSTNKSSVSSANQSDTGECDAKLDGAYSIGPNPVSTILNITQNIIEDSKVSIYNMYGALVIDGPSFDGTPVPETEPIGMDGLDSGLYIVRIVSATEVRTYNIIKQ